MKKAKQYADDILGVYESNKHKEDLREIVVKYVMREVFSKLIDESLEISKMRNCHNDECTKAILAEQINKWKSICRKANKVAPLLKENGFYEILKQHGALN